MPDNTAPPNRREFLGIAGAVVASAALSKPSGAEELAAMKRVGPIGVQLYTVRDQIKSDFIGTLARVATIGYKEVEFAGYFDHTPREVSEILKQNGLTAPSAHIGMPVPGAAWDKVIADAHVIGHRYLVCPWIDEKLRTVDGYKQVCKVFNEAGKQAKLAGIQFAFHNHAYVFTPLGETIPYNLLLAETDPALVKMEMDVYWIRDAGVDPLAYFRRYPGRFPLLHLKDMDKAKEMVDVGKGIIDWKTVLEGRGLAGTKHIFVEHDQPADPFESIANSYNYLSKLNV